MSLHPSDDLLGITIEESDATDVGFDVLPSDVILTEILPHIELVLFYSHLVGKENKLFCGLVRSEGSRLAEAPEMHGYFSEDPLRTPRLLFRSILVEGVANVQDFANLPISPWQVHSLTFAKNVDYRITAIPRFLPMPNLCRLEISSARGTFERLFGHLRLPSLRSVKVSCRTAKANRDAFQIQALSRVPTLVVSGGSYLGWQEPFSIPFLCESPTYHIHRLTLGAPFDFASMQKVVGIEHLILHQPNRHPATPGWQEKIISPSHATLVTLKVFQTKAIIENFTFESLVSLTSHRVDFRDCQFPQIQKVDVWLLESDGEDLFQGTILGPKIRDVRLRGDPAAEWLKRAFENSSDWPNWIRVLSLEYLSHCTGSMMRLRQLRKISMKTCSGFDFRKCVTQPQNLEELHFDSVGPLAEWIFRLSELCDLRSLYLNCARGFTGLDWRCRFGKLETLFVGRMWAGFRGPQFDGSRLLLASNSLLEFRHLRNSSFREEDYGLSSLVEKFSSQ